MLHSNERMDLITEYMTSYEEKIKMANKNGLFDAAKMFELFAVEVCNVWFGQKFSNLNVETATYPYIDLISENRELLVQVSTAQDVPTKIKSTLEKIRDSKDKKYSTLKNIVFFVLSNNSIDKIKEYSGDNQIGSVSFTVKDNLITTNDIITKAQNDLNFQKKLYKVLKDEYENFNINIRKFKGALELSNSGLKNIEGLINGEYEIDRNEFLEKITKDNERYISIQGGAGSGKSVLCKKYVENEKLVLYARAERFLEESHIDDIWGCCIQDVLECINGKKLIFFIDALEFIADCAETKFELLQYLYDMAAEYQNVYIVTSCRTSDKNAFIKLETNFSIKIYEVGDITEDELALLMKQYPIIHKMYKTNSYVDLLKSPFYINLIVSNSMDIDNIGDENSLREYIWKNIICLEEKSRMYGILSNKVRVILEYATNNPEYVIKIKVKISESNAIKEYWGNGNMWLAGIRDHNVPTLIGDVIFCLKEAIISSLEICKKDHEFTAAFANYVKETIYSKSNNIVLLTIIESIGMHFENELPGYALDLATSIELVHWDTTRYMLYKKNPTKELLERQILKTMGIPELKDRYELDKKCDLSIQEYVSHTQIYFDSMVQDKCYGILDYLYSIIKNDAENAQDYLQIQKMDMRGAKATKITDNIIMLEPQISGEAEKIVLRQEEFNKPKQRLNAAIKKCNDNMVSGQIDLPSTLGAIKVILELIKDTDMAFQYENLLILLIASAINHQELENEKREKFCTIWINGIEKLFSNGSFLADTALMPVLLNQLENDVAIGIKNKIKKIVLDCLMYKGQHGVIDEMAKYVKRYLANHETLAQAVFNTIIKLSEDQMEHQKYNANYLKVSKKDKEFIFNPNMQPKLSGIDRYIKDDDGNCYTSREEEIIDRYLLQEESLEIDVFDMSNYDISTICYVANCGLNFTNESFRIVIHEILLCVIDIWKYTKRNYNAYEIFDVYQEHEIIELFQREMIQTQDDAKMAIDILFEEIDFTKFTTDTIEFYQDIFGNFLCEFFDSYVDSKRRNICKKKILYIEKKVNDIDEEYVRIQLYKSLMLSVTRYCTGDWSKIKTNYSYVDKQFLNKQFTKYGKYHIKELLRTIYQMHMDELLPEILISIRNSFQNAKSEVNKFKKSIREQEAIVQLIILKSFITYSDKIKQDQELIEAYEDILEILINLNYEQAAVILDEFRIH